MDVVLVLEEKDSYRKLSVPFSLIRNLIQDRLTKGELARIDRAAEPFVPSGFKRGHFVANIPQRTARAYIPLDVDGLGTTWDIKVEPLTLENY